MLLVEPLVEFLSQHRKLLSFEFADRHTTPALARSNDGSKHQLHYRALAEGMRNDIRSPALLAEESFKQLGGARDSAMRDRHAQVRDAGLVIVTPWFRLIQTGAR